MTENRPKISDLWWGVRRELHCKDENKVECGGPLAEEAVKESSNNAYDEDKNKDDEKGLESSQSPSC